MPPIPPDPTATPPRLTATKTLPDDFTRVHTVNLGEWKTMVAMNLGGIVLLFVFGWIFMGVAAALFPAAFEMEVVIFVHLLSLRWFLITIIGVVVVHELCHGLFFWLFTRERPQIGFNLLYAYAGAPNWFFPRRQFVIVGLAPLVIITAVGLIWLPFAGILTLPRIVLALTVNAAGAIGDMIVVAIMLAQPGDVLVQDEGTQIAIYRAVR